MSLDRDIEKIAETLHVSHVSEDEGESNSLRSHRRGSYHSIRPVRSRRLSQGDETGVAQRAGSPNASLRSRKNSSPPLRYSVDLQHPTTHQDRRIELDCDDPGNWVIDHHLDGLVTELRQWNASPSQTLLENLWAAIRGVDNKKTSEHPNIGDGKRYRISFAEVQRMRIRKLQCQLVRDITRMRKEHREVDGWEQTLEQYIKALQDHDYMEKRSKSARDPFLATGEYNIDNYVLNCNIDDELVQMIETQQWSLKRWEEKNEKAEPICGTRGSNVSKMWQLGFRRRVAVAAMGGAFLLGPMWLMVLKKGLYISLISTTAFVTGFGLIMAYFLDQEKDVLASTAAYAAVLVVFIGTGTSG